MIQEQTHQRTQFVLYEFRLLVCQDNVISRSLKGFLRNPDILSDTNIISRIIMRYHKAEQSQDLLSVRALKLQLPYLSFVMWAEPSGVTLAATGRPSSVPLGAHCLESKTKLFMGSMHRGVQGPTMLHCRAGYNHSSPPCCT